MEGPPEARKWELFSCRNVGTRRPVRPLFLFCLYFICPRPCRWPYSLEGGGTQVSFVCPWGKGF